MRTTGAWLSRIDSARSLTLLVFGYSAAACGSNEEPPEGSAGTGTGGVATAGTVTGGAASGGAGTGGTATAGTGTGGAATGGTGTGGQAGNVASGGSGTGGSAATGGSATAGAAGTSGAAGSAGSGTAGATGTGGGSNCFPSITDFAARDGGFGSAEREIVEIDGGDSVSLFRPSDESFGEGCRYPLLVWGNGSTNTVDIWASPLSRAASFGFVIVAPEQTQVNSGHMNAALDYVLGLSEDSNSDYYDKVDTAKLGATGYSLGGAGAMQVAANVRIGATFIWDSFGNCSSLNGPLGTIVASDGLGGLDLIDDCPPPAFGMEAAGTSHTSILSYPGGFGGPGGQTPYAQESYVAWFRWHFMGDPAAEALFAGADCGFCTREGITVRKNGFD